MSTGSQNLTAELNLIKAKVLADSAGKGGMWIDTVIAYTLYLVPLVGLWLGFVNTLWMVLCVIAARSLGFIMLGTGPMHAGSHGAFSERSVLNRLCEKSMWLLGMSPDNWRIKHNVLHHVHTNIMGGDDDLTSPEPALLLSPYSRLRNAAVRFQHWYFPFAYSLIFVAWIFVRDFRMVVRFPKNPLVAARFTSPNAPSIARQFARLTIAKLLYFAAHFGPVLIGVPFWVCFATWLGTVMCAGFIMASAFQLAHVTGEVEMLPATYERHDHAEHQLATTANFTFYVAPLDWLMTRMLGGLNYQIEHHLWCGVSPHYYPKLATAVRTAVEARQDVRYRTRPLHVAFIEHWKYLRAMAHSGTPT